MFLKQTFARNVKGEKEKDKKPLTTILNFFFKAPLFTENF